MKTPIGSSNDYFADCARNGRTLTDCTVIDAHAHFGPTTSFPYVDSRIDSLIEVMDRVGIDRVCLSSNWAFSGYTPQGNDELLRGMKRFPGRFFGYMSVSVGYPEAILPELERCYNAGFRAIKIWNYGDRPGLPYNHPNYDLIFTFANERQIPVLAHTWGAELDQLDQAFQQYRKINWLLAHTGAQALANYIKAANSYERVYLDTCLSFGPRGLIERLVAEVALDKIIWGSDQPFLSATQQIGRVLLAQISPAQKRAILGENALRVLNIK